MSAYFWKGAESSVLRICLSGVASAVTSTPLVAELRRTLLDKIDEGPWPVERFLSRFMAVASVVEPSEALTIVSDDPDDDRVLECAVEGRAAYIITGDRHLLRLDPFGDVRIVRAPTFLHVLGH